MAALEPVFFARLCELLGRPGLAARQYDADQESLAAELAEALAAQPLQHWLGVFEGEDVCAGPVATLAEAGADSARRRPAARPRSASTRPAGGRSSVCDRR